MQIVLDRPIEQQFDAHLRASWQAFQDRHGPSSSLRMAPDQLLEKPGAIARVVGSNCVKKTYGIDGG